MKYGPACRNFTYQPCVSPRLIVPFCRPPQQGAVRLNSKDVNRSEVHLVSQAARRTVLLVRVSERGEDSEHGARAPKPM